MLADGVHADGGQVVGGDAQPDGVADGRGPRLELPGDLVEVAPPEMDLADHLATGEERRHRFEQLAPRPQRPGAHRPEHLVAAERVEVGPERLDVDRHVRHGLGAVDEDEGTGRVGHVDHVADRVDRPERVRDVGEGDQLRAQAEQHLEHVEPEDPVVGDRDELEVPVLLLDQDLPRDEVGVMLHLGQDDGVAAVDVPAAPRVGHQVDRLGRVAGEHDLAAIGGVDEARDLGPRRLVGGRRLLADGVDAAMDVGVVLAVVVGHRVDDDVRLLAARRGVEVDQPVTVDLLVEDREVGPQRVRVEDALALRGDRHRIAPASGRPPPARARRRPGPAGP